MEMLERLRMATTMPLFKHFLDILFISSTLNVPINRINLLLAPGKKQQNSHTKISAHNKRLR